MPIGVVRATARLRSGQLRIKFGQRLQLGGAIAGARIAAEIH